MKDESRDKIKACVNCIAEQIGEIGKMIDDDCDWLVILGQIAVARSALHSLGVDLITNHYLD